MKTVVFDADDFQDRWDKNGLNILFYWKSRYPNFKATLFTIPGRTSNEMLQLIDRNKDWIQLGGHGLLHDTNFEVQYWDEKKMNAVLDFIESTGYYQKLWKYPGWQITYPQPYNDKPDSQKPVNSNPQLIYNILKERGYCVADQCYNKSKRPEELKVYCSCNSLMVHGHTWPMDQGEPNGLEQIERAGVPWNQDDEFKFISELSDEELKCRF
jgi:hypothetical protein